MLQLNLSLSVPEEANQSLEESLIVDAQKLETQ